MAHALERVTGIPFNSIELRINSVYMNPYGYPLNVCVAMLLEGLHFSIRCMCDGRDANVPSNLRSVRKYMSELPSHTRISVDRECSCTCDSSVAW